MLPPYSPQNPTQRNSLRVKGWNERWETHISAMGEEVTGLTISYKAGLGEECMKVTGGGLGMQNRC